MRRSPNEMWESVIEQEPNRSNPILVDNFVVLEKRSVGSSE